MSTYRGLGFDPVPGDVGTVSALADALVAAGQHATDAHTGLHAAVERSAGWTGQAAEAFRRSAATVPDRLLDHAGTARQAADVLYDWAGTLSDNRLQAEQLDRRARALAEQIATAEHNVEQWSIALSVASTHTRAEARATLLEHEHTLAQLQDRLTAVRAAAHQLAADHHRAADQTAARLTALATSSPSAPTTEAPPAVSSRSASSASVAGQGGAAGEVGAALDALAVLTQRAGRIAALVPGGGVAPSGSGLSAAVAALAGPVPGPGDTAGTWHIADTATPVEALARAARVG